MKGTHSIGIRREPEEEENRSKPGKRNVLEDAGKWGKTWRGVKRWVGNMVRWRCCTKPCVPNGTMRHARSRQLSPLFTFQQIRKTAASGAEDGTWEEQASRKQWTYSQIKMHTQGHTKHQDNGSTDRYYNIRAEDIQNQSYYVYRYTHLLGITVYTKFHQRNKNWSDVCTSLSGVNPLL